MKVFENDLLKAPFFPPLMNHFFRSSRIIITSLFSSPKSQFEGFSLSWDEESVALQCTPDFLCLLPFQLTFQELMNFAAQHLQNDFLHKTAAVKNVLAFSHSRGLKINEPCDIITEKPKQTRGFNDSRKSFGVCFAALSLKSNSSRPSFTT